MMMGEEEGSEEEAYNKLLRDTIVSFVVVALILAGVLLYIAEEPGELIISWMWNIIIVSAFALGLLKFADIVRYVLARLVGGTAHTMPVAPSAAAQLDTLSALRPEDMFALWANASLVSDPAGVVVSNEAYQHYSDACAVNGVQPMSSNRFGVMLTARATSSGGTVIKTKAGGRMSYRGWALNDGSVPTAHNVAG